jgi:hypothetical protein
MSAVCPLFLNASFAGCGLPWLVAPRRVFAPAGRPTFFAGAKKVGKETPNTSLFERWWFKHLARLRRVVRFVATSIHFHVKGFFFHHPFPSTTVIPAKAGIHTVLVNDALNARRYIPWIPAFAGMTERRAQLWHEVLRGKSKPKTLPERQWPLAEHSLHVCAPAPSFFPPNRLVFRCFFGDFLCTSKESYSAAGPRPGAVPGVTAINTKAIPMELNDVI